MKKTGTPFFCQTTLAAALLLAFGGACAQEAPLSPDDIRKDLYTPDSRVAVGLGYQSSDNRRFGQYRSLTDEGAYGLLDLDLVKRDDATGTWLKLKGKTLGLDSRSLRFEHERQGNWSYFIEGNRMSRSEPLVVNTGLQGIGTSQQTVSATAPKRDVDLKVDHDIYALGVRKFVAGGLDVRVTFKQDEKKGDRMYGVFTTGMEFLTEPIDRVTRQWEIVAGYADRKLQLSGGYSGSSYDTNMPVLTDISGATRTPLALPPSNNAHQLHLAGGYNWSDTTRNSFKLSRSVAYQNERFDPVFTTIRPADSLDGKLVTTLAFADLTMRPMDRLDVTGALRYEDRDDQTPEAKYLTLTSAQSLPSTTGAFSSAGVTGYNKPRSLKQIKGTLEASYRLDDGYRLVGSLEREDMTRNAPAGHPVGYLRVGYRENTNETTERIEIKRTMSETLNGSVALSHSARGGSDYIPDTFVVAANTNQNNALLWADRSRDKLRVTADWIPADQWSLQFLADFSDDSYSGRNMGPRKGTAQFFSGDASYRINDKWNLSTWLSQEQTSAKQSTRTDPSAGAVLGNILWNADLRDTTTAWGISLKGKPRANLELGVDLSSSLDTAEHNLAKTGGTGTAAVNSLPDYFYRQLSLKLFADYALDRKSGIRVDFVVDHRRNNDWTWQNWTYADGTTVTNVASENTAFIGVSYHYRWR